MSHFYGFVSYTIIMLLYNTNLLARIQTASELARGDSGVAKPFFLESIYYNPSGRIHWKKKCDKRRLKSLENIVGKKFFESINQSQADSNEEKDSDETDFLGLSKTKKEFNLTPIDCNIDDNEFTFNFATNKNGKNIIENYYKLSKLSTASTIDQIKHNLGENYFSSGSTYFSSIVNSYFSYSLNLFAQYNSSIYGETIPIVYSNFESNLQVFLSYAFPITDSLWFGFNIRPIYKLENKILDEIFMILEDPEALTPVLHGTEGVGLGKDISATYRIDLDEDSISFAFVVDDFLSTKYSKVSLVTSDKNSDPEDTFPRYTIASTYSNNMLSIFNFSLNYAYYDDKNIVDQNHFHKGGISLQVNENFGCLAVFMKGDLA